MTIHRSLYKTKTAACPIDKFQFALLSRIALSADGIELCPRFTWWHDSDGGAHLESNTSLDRVRKEAKLLWERMSVEARIMWFLGGALNGIRYAQDCLDALDGPPDFMEVVQELRSNARATTSSVQSLIMQVARRAAERPRG